ncbi:MAG: hypothetical protein FWC38_01305 [Proteobacteria bacterium]|nr:hypothetical protein [Pseudomonadota bacterium]
MDHAAAHYTTECVFLMFFLVARGLWWAQQTAADRAYPKARRSEEESPLLKGGVGEADGGLSCVVA